MASMIDHHRLDGDVAMSTADDWARVAVASASDRVAALVHGMHAAAEDSVDQAVRRILHHVDGYDSDGIVERDDLWWSVHRNLEVVLLALAEQRTLTASELGVLRELGRRRAQQGVSLDQLMRAFRVGYATLWEGLAELASQRGPAYAEALLERAAQVWLTFDEVTTTVAAAYRQLIDTRHLDRRRRAVALLSGLHSYPKDAARTEQIARSLALDPHGTFVVAVLSPVDRPIAAEPEILFVEQPDRVVVVAASSGEPSRMEATLAGLLRRRRFDHVGVGILRAGLGGAQQSLADAQLAHRLAIASGAPAVVYRESWLACVALRHRDQLELLVGPALQALRHDGELLETLEAFLQADGNLTAAGKALYVHPNTVAYRVKQFARRSGIDPRTAAGMALTQVSLTYARLAPDVVSAEP